MKRPLLLLLAALPLIGSAAAKPAYLRPTISYVKPADSAYSSATAGGLAAGIYLGPRNEHEIGYEWAYTHWDTRGSYSGVSFSSRESFMPHLLNYRYHFPLSEAYAVSFYVGPSLGFSYNKVEAQAASATQRVSLNATDWTFSVGGTAGVELKLTPRIDLNLGYRYLTLEGSSYTAFGSTVKTEDTHASIAYAGIGFRF